MMIFDKKRLAIPMIMVYVYVNDGKQQESKPDGNRAKTTGFAENIGYCYGKHIIYQSADFVNGNSHIYGGR